MKLETFNLAGFCCRGYINMHGELVFSIKFVFKCINQDDY